MFNKQIKNRKWSLIINIMYECYELGQQEATDYEKLHEMLIDLFDEMKEKEPVHLKFFEEHFHIGGAK